MICRVWKGWTTAENAANYERIVREDVIPEIESRGIAGFIHIDLMRRSAGDEVEFQTIMWFDSMQAIIQFVGPDPEISHVPPAARSVLTRFEGKAAHYDVLDRRPQHLEA